jgi:DNA-binding response OmpR family regulator
MKMNLSVLLICNQTAMVDQIRALMAELGQDMDVLHSMDAFEDEFSTNLHLCLLDATESSEAAFELTARLRQVHPFAGLVCITNPHCLPKRVQAWKSGADLVIGPSLDAEEFRPMMLNLLQRVRHTPQACKPEVLANQLELDSQRRSLYGPNAEVPLTSTEYLLLQSLARAKERTLALWQIYDLLGKTEQTLKKPALEAQLYRLRKKLRDCGAGNQALKAVRLKGYQLCVAICIK